MILGISQYVRSVKNFPFRECVSTVWLAIRISMFVRSLIASASAVLLAGTGALAGGHGAPAAGAAPDVKMLFSTTKTLEGDSFEYPDGASEMRLFRVAFLRHSFPLHTHPSPLLIFIQQGKIGLVKPNGKTHVFMPGDTFVIADKTPAHTMENMGLGQAVMMVSVVSVEGMETVVMAQP